jgi:hypothetical protein
MELENHNYIHLPKFFIFNQNTFFENRKFKLKEKYIVKTIQ